MRKSSGSQAGGVYGGGSDSNTLNLGERDAGGNKLGPANVDTNKYDYAKGKRDAQGGTQKFNYTRQYAPPANEHPLGDKWDPIRQENTVDGPLKSGDYKNVPLTKYASGGQTSTGFNPKDLTPAQRKAMAFQGSDGGLPKQYVFGQKRKQG